MKQAFLISLRGGLASVLFVDTIFCAGCTAKQSPSPQKVVSNEHDHHDHDHGVTPLKPVSFAKAIQRLPRWIWSVASEFKAGHQDHAREATDQLQDVIRWLPELAADSDLGEGDWTMVQQTCRQMEAIVQPWSTGRTPPTRDDIDSLVALTEHLKPLAELAQSDHLEHSRSGSNVASDPDRK